MAVSKRNRFEVFKRDLFACQYCGRTPPAVVLECDHIEPVARGGHDRQDNLITACLDCNRGKSDRPLDSAPVPLLQQIADRKERANQLKAYSNFQAEQRRLEDQSILRLGRYWCNRIGYERDRYAFNDDRAASMRVFLRKMTESDLTDSIDIAFARKPPQRKEQDDDLFRYFCGIVWSKIREAEA